MNIRFPLNRFLQSTALCCILLSCLALSGCPSFETSVKPLIASDSTADTNTVYITGTTTINQVDPSSLTLDIWRIVTDAFPDSVRIYARVYSKGEGKFVGGLAPPYYRGTEDYHTIWNGLTEKMNDDGRPVTIADYTVREFSDQDGIPFEISLVLDYSGTMTTNIKSLEDAATGFVNLKRPQDRIALVKFSREAKLAASLTDEKDSLLKQFGKGLKGFGSYTALYAAMKLGAEQVAGAPTEHPRALVLFTDGEDNASSITSSELYQYCKKNSIPVFAVAFGMVNREVLSNIAESTGGKFYQTTSPSQFAKVFEDIYRSLHNYYLISYKPLPYGGKHVVSIGLNPRGSSSPQTASGSYTVDGISDRTLDSLSEFESLYFDYNTATLRPESQQIIEIIARAMKANPRMKIEVRGHASSEGPEEHNMELSQQRAEVARVAIVQLGVEENRVQIRAFGASQPIANNATEEGRQKNRRASFVILLR